MRFLNPHQIAHAVWNLIAVTSRTVEVNTKTGFSLATSSSGVIKSIQRGTITIAVGGANTQTATITAVVVAKTRLAHLGQTATAAGATARIALTDTTTITATRDNAFNANEITVSYEAVEEN